MVTFPLNVSSLTGSELFSYLKNDFGTYGEDYILYTYKNSNYEKMNYSYLATLYYLKEKINFISLQIKE